MITQDVDTRAREENFININTIQSAGRLTPEAMKAMIAYGDGYSTCDYCQKPFRLDKIDKPPIAKFHEELEELTNMDKVRLVPGARRGFQAAVNTAINENDTVLVSAISHYSEVLAVEQAGGKIREVPMDENNIHTAEKTEQKIKEVKEKEGELPKLIMVDHFDSTFGNRHEIEKISKISDQYDIPILINCAYSLGVLPIDGKEMGADFIVGSGHKSFASPAPSGILGANGKWAEKVFRTTEAEGDVTGRTFGVKEVEMLGCTLMGSNTLAMMASLPKVKERVKNWDEELEKANYLVEEFLKIEGNKVKSEMPRKHTIVKVDTRESYDKIAKDHDRRGYFFYDELKERGIIGVFPGATRSWKMNSYGLTWGQVEYLAEAFKDIAKKYDLKVEE